MIQRQKILNRIDSTLKNNIIRKIPAINIDDVREVKDVNRIIDLCEEVTSGRTITK